MNNLLDLYYINNMNETKLINFSKILYCSKMNNINNIVIHIFDD